MSSVLEFQKSIFSLKTTILFREIVIWNSALIFLIICNNREPYELFLFALLVCAIVCFGLAYFHFKIATNRSAQTQYLEPARMRYFNPEFFVFSIFTVMFIALFAYLGLTIYAL